MKRILIVLSSLLLSMSLPVCAAEETLQGLVLEKAPINRQDLESIKRGATIFATTCMSCHTLMYLRYDKLSQDTGIKYEKMPINIKSWPYGVTPPDLSLETEVRGADWVYTYLHSFYVDKNRPTGVNNLLVHNTAMPAILAPYQGQQELVALNPMNSSVFGEVHWYDLLKLTQKGSVPPEKFDQMTADLVNYLSYAAEPFYIQQHHLGWWVLGFLTILFVLMYLLKKEYWKDVKKMGKGDEHT